MLFRSWNELTLLKELRLNVMDVCFGQSWIDNMLSLTPGLRSLQIPISAPQLSLVIQSLHKHAPQLKELSLTLSWLTHSTSHRKRIGGVHVFPFQIEAIDFKFDFERTDLSDIVTVLLAATLNPKTRVTFNVLPPLTTPVPEPMQYIKDRIEHCIDNLDGVTRDAQVKLKNMFKQMNGIADFPECFRHLLLKMGLTP